MPRRRILAAILVGLVAATVGAFAVAAGDDPRFPETIAARVGGKPVRLTLTGTAVRKKYGFSIYSVASYLQEGVRVRNAAALMTVASPKQLHLIFDRDVDGPTMAKAFRASIGASHPAPAFAAELERLERYFVAHPTKQGDHIWLTYVPAVGLAYQVNNQPGVVVEGVAFAEAAWGTYLGPNNLGVAIKTGLTSRLR